MILALQLTACDPQPIRIGFIATLSGPDSQLGIAERNGVLISVDKANKNGGVNGRKIELVVRDDHNNDEVARQLYREFRTQDIPAVIGPALSRIAMAIHNEMRPGGPIFISPTASTPLLSGKDDDFLRVIQTQDIAGAILADAMSQLGIIRVAVVSTEYNTAYSAPIIAEFERVAAQKKNLNVVYRGSLQSDGRSCFRCMAEAIIASGAQAVMAPVSAMDAAILCQLLKKQNADIRFFATRWTRQQTFIENGGRAAEGALFEGHYEKSVRSGAVLEFTREHTRRFGTANDWVAEYARDAFEILRYALETAATPTPAAIKEAIVRKSRFHSFDDVIQIDTAGDAQRKSGIYEVRGGNFWITDLAILKTAGRRAP